MLKVGSFSRIANVSVRLLHYYEELGLFVPAHIDVVTGYRYYKMEQMKDLNKILALKDLGLSLQEIGLILREDISSDEMRGMLRLKKSQVLQSVQGELLRLRRIEERLKQIDTANSEKSLDVVIKSVAGQRYFACRNRQLPINEFGSFVRQALGSLSGKNIAFPGTLCILEHSDSFPDEFFDLELGFLLAQDANLGKNSLMLHENYRLEERELPAVEQVASLLHVGAWGTGADSYIALGVWIEAHGYELAGASREVYLEVARAESEKNVVEFQLPIKVSERTSLL